MSNIVNRAAASEESWRTQLTELNHRSRWYASQLWQVPFAYLGLTGVIVGTFIDKRPTALPIALFGCAIFGIFVSEHAAGITEGLQRAVENLQVAEQALGLPQTAKFRARGYTDPLRFSVMLTTGVYGAFGFWMALEWLP